MRYIKPLMALTALCCALAWTMPAMAYGHHGARVGVFIGGEFGPWYSPYYYPPYPGYGYGYGYGYSPYYAPVLVAPAAPTVYVEQGSSQQAAPSWFYCADPQGYFPYVQQCRNGWQRVSPTPPQ